MGTLLAFGEPAAVTVVAVLAYRLIAYWLPTLPEAVAYLMLRRTVSGWRAEEDESPPGAAAARAGADTAVEGAADPLETRGGLRTGSRADADVPGSRRV